MPRTPKIVWQLQRHFRRNAFGWRNGPPRTRLKEAVSELKRAAKRDPVLAAEGAVRLIERLPPALEQTDDSSGALGNAIRNLLAFAVDLINAAGADARTREDWLERLWVAYENDERPWIEGLGELWGALCGDTMTAARWSERLTPRPRRPRGEREPYEPYDRCTVPWLSAALQAGRYDAIVAALKHDDFWLHVRWAVAALRAKGETEAALRRAETAAESGLFVGDPAQVCEELLRELGRHQEAFERYALAAHESSSRVKWLKSLLAAYPERDPGAMLAALVATTPGQEGRWFAAARQAGLLDAAVALAERSATEPATLITAVKQHAESEPPFTLRCGLLALRGLLRGDAFDPEKIDLDLLVRHLTQAADALGVRDDLPGQIDALLQAHARPGDGWWAPRIRRALT
ncbi:MAG: hypothetical protein EA417_02465 [Gammaproteobacteria bacterium]|nr:MAG: hypothetical protein EA417_02465 [Gammaproteobacteria bacterium]